MVAACDGPLSTLAPSGPAAQQIATLWWVMLAGSAAITLLVGVMIVLAMRRPPRERSDDKASRVWITGWGLAFTLSVLTALLGYALFTGERMLARDDGTFRVEAQAHQWDWQFVQPGPDGTPVTTQGILYVPAGQPFDVQITSQDVIHSFWVPQLGGKMDAIPGHVNLHRLFADRPGTYEGLCAEFCGIGHSAMRFEVVVYDPAAPLPDFVDAPLPGRATPDETTPDQTASDTTAPQETLP